MRPTTSEHFVRACLQTFPFVLSTRLLIGVSPAVVSILGGKFRSGGGALRRIGAHAFICHNTVRFPGDISHALYRFRDCQQISETPVVYSLIDATLYR